MWDLDATNANDRLNHLCHKLGEQRFTNVLVEGGGQLLGSLFDLQLIDEVHVFVAAKIIGGQDATSPLGGMGLDSMADAIPLRNPQFELLGADVYIHGRTAAGNKAD